jgi:hypothetical protein
MIVTLRNTETECDEIYTNIERISEQPSKIILYKNDGFEKTFDKDIYSVIRKDG